MRQSNLNCHSAVRALALIVVAWFWLVPGAWAADRLVWSNSEGLVDAQIEGWPLAKLLGRLSAKTKWRIYIEPGTDRVVQAKFSGLKPGEALRRLLGSLNFMLVPQTNGPPKLFVFKTSADAATDLVGSSRLKGGARLIENEIIVTLRPGSRTSIDDLARRLGAKIVGRAEGLRAYRLRFESEDAARAAEELLAEDDDTFAADSNFELDRPDSPDSLTDGKLPAFRLKPKSTADGSQVIVGLIDTAVQLDGTVIKDFALPQVSVAGPAQLPVDQPTHGTTMAETILYGLARAPESKDGTPVRILPVDIYGNNEATTSFDIASGIYTAIEKGASIINMSVGGDTDMGFVRDVIRLGREQGVVFVGAAGNEPVTAPTFPAAYPEVIAVTAVTRDGRLASYANRGGFVDAAAPGMSIVPFQDKAYYVIGTSTAAANVSAFAAAAASTGKRGAELEAQIRAMFGLRSAPAGGP